MVIPARRGPRTDNGLFGPGSLTWEIWGHPATLIGAGRSMHYSALVSEVANAVNDHSKVFVDPWPRTQETQYWITSSVFGDTTEARRAGKWVEGVHSKVRGIDPVSGKDYSPSRPNLAMASHCLIWECGLASHEAYVRELSDHERDTYWQEGIRIAELLDIDPATIPQTWQDWRTYYDTTLFPRLTYSPGAHRILTFLRSGAGAPLWIRPLVKLTVTLAEELALPTLAPTERAMVGRPRSQARMALTRQLGRPIVALTSLRPIRDIIERSYGGHAHELLAEARALANHDRARPTAGPTSRSVGAGSRRRAGEPTEPLPTLEPQVSQPTPFSPEPTARGQLQTGTLS